METKTYDLKAVSKEEFENYLESVTDKFYVLMSESSQMDGTYEAVYITTSDVFLGSILFNADEAEHLIPDNSSEDDEE